MELSEKYATDSAKNPEVTQNKKKKTEDLTAEPIYGQLIQVNR